MYRHSVTKIIKFCKDGLRLSVLSEADAFSLIRACRPYRADGFATARIDPSGDASTDDLRTA